MGEGHVGGAGEQKLDRPAAAGNAAQGATQAETGREVGRGDADVARGFQQSEQLAAEFVADQVGAAEEHGTNFAGAGLRRSSPAGDATEQPRTKLMGGKHLVEGRDERVDGGRVGELKAEIAPAGGDAVAVVFGSDIEAAGDRDGIVDDENFAMIPDRKMAETDRVEDPDGTAGIFQFLPVARG